MTTAASPSPWRFSVAPMMDWTDRHDRFFLRQLSGRARLYTEMVTARALAHGEVDRLLAFDPAEQPVALQVGGAEPDLMARAAELAQRFGYAEVNVNVGCPSDRVVSGRFGACLMAEPDTVAACVAAMRRATDLPVTVKTRIGIDDQDSYRDLERFVEAVAAAGCTTFVVHARKAWLNGLSPKENREVPPLDYDRVYRLKAEHPALTVAINGGIKTLDQAAAHLSRVDGVMVGREAYQNPWLLAEVDRRLFGDPPRVDDRLAVVEAMVPYVEARLAEGVALHAITRHMMGLFQGLPGARAWRRHLSEHGPRPGAGVEVLRTAVEPVAAALDRRADREAA
jgi:tRNA-dihydrouridine synthase A